MILMAVLALASAVVCALAMRGRRVDNAPLCRRCRFELLGIEIGEGARCPECGRALSAPGAVRFGRRRRMTRTAAIAGVASLLLAAGGAALGWGRARGFNWYSIHPLWLLRLEARTDSGPIRAPALGELVRRFESDPRYERVALDELVEEALALQADRTKPWIPEWGDLVEIAWLRGDLSREQKRRYIEKNIHIELRTRTNINDGDSLPLRYLPWYRLARKPRIELTTGFERVWQWPDDHYQGEYGFHFGSVGGLVRSGGGLHTSTRLCIPPGAHDLTQCWRITVHEGRWRTRDGRGNIVGRPEESLVANWLQLVQAEFEVCPPERPAIVTHTDASTGESIARSIKLQIRESKGPTPRLTIDWRIPQGEREVRANAIAMLGQRSWSYPYPIGGDGRSAEWTIDDWATGPKSLTIALACDGQAARLSSLSARETWSGILLLEDIPIDGEWHEPTCVTILPYTTENRIGFAQLHWSGLERAIGGRAK